MLGAGIAALAAAITGVVGQGTPRVVKVSARRFTFTPAQIALKAGEPVTLEIVTEDVFMGFNVPDLKLRADIVPGRTARLALPPLEAGSYPFLCDVFCGEGHESMGGTIVVA